MRAGVCTVLNTRPPILDLAMFASKIREIVEEFQTLVLGRSRVTDALLPPVLFLVVNAVFGINYAILVAVGLGLLLAVVRLRRSQSVASAFGGLGGVIIAAFLVAWLGRAEAYFLPGMFTGLSTVALCTGSILVGRPLVAWTSYVARRWPLGWYWHPKVLPAYNEVTLMWTAYFGARLVLQIALFRSQATLLLAFTNVVAGWPATAALLIISYLYGSWRLRRLGGPGVDEFQQGAEPPWTGQRRGF